MAGLKVISLLNRRYLESLDESIKININIFMGYNILLKPTEIYINNKILIIYKQKSFEIKSIWDMFNFIRDVYKILRIENNFFCHISYILKG